MTILTTDDGHDVHFEEVLDSGRERRRAGDDQPDASSEACLDLVEHNRVPVWGLLTCITI